MASLPPVAPKPGYAAPLASARPSLEKIVRTWAAGLTLDKAPDPKVRGPLAWVRGEKLEELVRELAKAGYR